MKKAWDAQIAPFTGQTDNDIIASGILSGLATDDVEGVPKFRRWPWGKREEKRLLILASDNFNPALVDSINEGTDISPDNELPVRKIYRMSLDSLKAQFNLNVTIAQALAAPAVPARVKTYINNKILTISGITTATTLAQLLDNPEVPKQWLKFRRIRRQWISFSGIRAQR